MNIYENGKPSINAKGYESQHWAGPDSSLTGTTDVFPPAVSREIILYTQGTSSAVFIEQSGVSPDEKPSMDDHWAGPCVN